MHYYPKINSVYKRDQKGRMIIGLYSNEYFEYLKNLRWAFTEKVDGMCIAINYSTLTRTMTINGHTDKTSLAAWQIEAIRKAVIAEQLSSIFSDDILDVWLFAEFVGEKINKGGKYVNNSGHKLILFDVRVNEKWLERSSVVQIANMLQISHAPTIGFGTLLDMTKLVQQGFTSAFGHFPAEGIVARPIYELSYYGERIITKLKTKDFNRALEMSNIQRLEKLEI